MHTDVNEQMETLRLIAQEATKEAERAKSRIRELEAGMDDALECLESWGEVIPAGERDRYGYHHDLSRLRDIRSGDFSPWWAHARLAVVPNGEVW